MPETPVDQLFETAVSHHQAGKLQEAEAACRQILASRPNDADVIQLLAVVSYQLGQKEPALQLLRRALELNPQAPDGHYHLAVVLADLEQHTEAISSFRQAVTLKPDFVEAHHLLGVSLRAAGQWSEAAEAFRRVLALKADHFEAWNNLGTVLKAMEKFDDAIVAYRRALALRSDVAAIHSNLANAIAASGQWADAIVEFRQALSLEPANWAVMLALGTALQASGDLNEAIGTYRQILALRPDSGEASARLADALRLAGQLDEACMACRQAVALMPDSPAAHNTMGLIYHDQGRMEEAVAEYHQALVRKPDYADASYNLGNVLLVMGRLENAAVAFRQAIRHRRDFFMAHNNLGAALKEMRQIEQAIACFDTAMSLEPREPASHSNRLYTLHYAYGQDQATIFQEHLRWDEHYGRPLSREIQPHRNDPNPDRRLRIGYLSPYFHEHSVAIFLENLLRTHDAAQVDVFCYADVSRPDDVTRRLQQVAHHWRDITRRSDADVAQMVRDDQIDLLVDLAGHAAGSRLRVFARKPAPIQITYLGYPDTTGLQTMDYRLTDAYADPPGQTEKFHTEQLWRLPRTFLCYCPPPDAPPVGPLPASASGRVTFGSFNALAKITAPIVDAWSQILRQVPSSRMIIKSHSGLADHGPRQSLLDLFAAGGITPDRLELLAKTPTMDAHLKLYQQIDIALDTYPYHGTATTCQALWMGVPVVTLAGAIHAGRVGVSILSNASLPQLIADTPQKYVQIAVDLAKDLPALAQLRSSLRQRLSASPLMDGAQFARDVEAAYRQMWRTWCQSR